MNIRPYRMTLLSRLSASLLLAVILLFSAGKALHVLHESHHHSDLKVCELDEGDGDGTQHLHDAHFLTEDCSLCDYLVGGYDLPDWHFQLVLLVRNDVFSLPFHVGIPSLAVEITANALRGPPTFFYQD